jgi:hypothetical protein
MGAGGQQMPCSGCKSLAVGCGNGINGLGIPVLIIVANQPVPGLSIWAVVIWLNDFVVVAVIFYFYFYFTSRYTYIVFIVKQTKTLPLGRL